MKLIDDWRQFWRFWSVRLGAVASVIITLVLAMPDVLMGALNALPADMRAALPPFVGIALFATVTLARLLEQKKPGGH